LAKSVCKVCGQWFEDSELDEHLNQHTEEPEETQSVQKGDSHRKKIKRNSATITTMPRAKHEPAIASSRSFNAIRDEATQKAEQYRDKIPQSARCISPFRPERFPRLSQLSCPLSVLS